MPPLIRPAATSIAPCQMTRMMALKIKRDDDRGHHRAQQDAFLGGGEDGLGRGGEALALAALLVERLDDLHRAEHLAGDGADVGDAVLAADRHRAQAAAEQGDRHDHEGDAEQHHARQLGGEEEQDHGAGQAHHEVAQRDRQGGADDLFDDRGVDRQPAGDLGRAILLEEAGREAQQVAVHREANVGDDPLAEPRDEVEARRGGERHDDDQRQQDVEPAGDIAGIAAARGKPRSMISLKA